MSNLKFKDSDSWMKYSGNINGKRAIDFIGEIIYSQRYDIDYINISTYPNVWDRSYLTSKTDKFTDYREVFKFLTDKYLLEIDQIALFMKDGMYLFFRIEDNEEMYFNFIANKRVLENQQARWESESPRKLTEEEKKEVERRKKEIEAYGKKMEAEMSERLRKELTEEYLSKKRIIELWQSKKLDEIEVGTFEGLRKIHFELFNGLERFKAGKIRNVNISIDNTSFLHHMYLDFALKKIEEMPEDTFDQIIEKYVEMNVAHPFIFGNGISMRIWLDLMLKKNLKKCIDWQKLDKFDYLEFMEFSPAVKNIYNVFKDALTDKIDDVDIFMNGLDQSYTYDEFYQVNSKEIYEKIKSYKQTN